MSARLVSLLTLVRCCSMLNTAHAEPEEIAVRDPKLPPPAGYHRERRVRRKLVIAGAITGGSGLLLLGTGLASLAANDGSSGGGLPIAPVFILFGALGTAAGVPLFTVGLLAQKNVDVPNVNQVRWVPLVTPSSAYLSYRGSF